MSASGRPLAFNGKHKALEIQTLPLLRCCGRRDTNMPRIAFPGARL